MTSRFRFNAASQVFDAFPRVTAEIRLRPADEAPLDFARRLLADGSRFDAIVYVACLLPRRESVWWACQCIRALRPDVSDDAVAAAEAWVREPEDEQRRAALAVGNASDPERPTTWLALAAGHSGGSIAPEDSIPVHAAPEATATNVKAGLILALVVDRPPADIQTWLAACVEAGLRFADGGDAKVSPPPLAVTRRAGAAVRG